MELLHLEKVVLTVLVFLVEALLRYVVVCHGGSFGMSSGKCESEGLGGLPQNVVFLLKVLRGFLTVVV